MENRDIEKMIKMVLIHIEAAALAIMLLISVVHGCSINEIGINTLCGFGFMELVKILLYIVNLKYLK